MVFLAKRKQFCFAKSPKNTSFWQNIIYLVLPKREKIHTFGET